MIDLAGVRKVTPSKVATRLSRSTMSPSTLNVDPSTESLVSLVRVSQRSSDA